MTREQARYVFCGAMVAFLLILGGVSCAADVEETSTVEEAGEETLQPGEEDPRSVECGPVEVVDGVVVEDLKLAGDGFHPCYERFPEHPPICLQGGWKARWTCEACARGEGRDLDFMVKLTPAGQNPIDEGECRELWNLCRERDAASESFSEDGFRSPGPLDTAPFDEVEFNAPRVIGAFTSFEIDKERIEVDGAFSVPRISAKGFLQAGPIREESRGYCYKLDYILYDAETGDEVDRVDPHIVGGI